MRTQMNREQIWQVVPQPWDLVIVGGGITGAGVLREATRHGLRALLVEQKDFAWGTSSRSSKLVHGGLRYLKEGKLFLMRDAVTEREQLLHEGPGLIDPLGFLMTVHRDEFPGRWGFEVALTVYDLLALQWDHHYYSAEDFSRLAPDLSQDDLSGGFRFGDAQTDDARLVLRVIQESVEDGGVALNYAAAERLLRDDAGQVTGVVVCDQLTGRQVKATARAVINATGAWVDRLRQQVGGAPRIRPLRGSHLVFSASRFPISQAFSFFHPIDQRPVFIFPWEGVTLVGTTDVDHHTGLDQEPAISPQEAAYLMAAVDYSFPSLQLTLDDVIATFAGVRPVIGTGKLDPSRESRDHVVWQEAGLLTVTGGKLTTFQLIAQDALKALHFREIGDQHSNVPVLKPVGSDLLDGSCLDEATRRRLVGWYGVNAPEVLAGAKPGETEPVPGTRALWAELRWAARREQVIHLDDLLLRRVRLGLLLPHGGEQVLPRARQICQEELGWDEARWEQEVRAYQDLCQQCYALPERSTIPDWRVQLAQAREKRIHAHELRAEHLRLQDLSQRKLWAAAALAALTAGFMGFLWFHHRTKRHEEAADE